MDISQSRRKMINCDDCRSKRLAAHRCLGCSKNFCIACITEKHNQMIVTRSHKLIAPCAIDDPGVDGEIKPRTVCSKHPNKKLRISRQTCGKMFCTLCIRREHRRHKIKDTVFVAKSKRDLCKSETKKTKINSSVENIKTPVLGIKKKRMSGSFDQIVLPSKYSVSFLHGRIKCVADLRINSDFVIYALAPIADNKAWVSWCESVIFLIDDEGTTLKEIAIDAISYEVTADAENNCIAAGWPDRLTRVTQKGKAKHILSNTDSCPRGVAYRIIDDKEEIIFSCFDGTIHKISYPKSADIMPFSSDYQQPMSVATDPRTGNVAIADVQANKVHILDRQGRKLATYDCGKTEHIIQSMSKCVCFDHQGCILVSNSLNKPVKRIGVDGQFIEELPELCGYALGMSPDGARLWVGGDVVGVKIYQLPE